MKKNGLYGYYSTAGEMVISFQFENVSGFMDNDLAWIKQDEKWGLITSKGQKVVYEDIVCNVKVIKNIDGQIVWPKKSVDEICGETK